MRLMKPILPEAETARMTMVIIVDEIEEEEEGRRKKMKEEEDEIKEGKQQIRKDRRKDEGNIRR